MIYSEDSKYLEKSKTHDIVCNLLHHYIYIYIYIYIDLLYNV